MKFPSHGNWIVARLRFTPMAVARYAPRIRKFTTDCVDRFIARGNCDLVTELANPVPSMTALEFIGFDPAALVSQKKVQKQQTKRQCNAHHYELPCNIELRFRRAGIF